MYLTTLLTLSHRPRIYSHRRHLFLHLFEDPLKLLSAIHTYHPNGGGSKDWLDDCRPLFCLHLGEHNQGWHRNVASSEQDSLAA